MTQYRVLGTNDEQTHCDVCPQVNLKKTVVLEILDVEGNGNGEIIRVGTTCAGMLTGKPSAKIKKLAETMDYAAAQALAGRRENARLILDAYVCVLDNKRELYARFWARNPALRRENAAGVTSVRADEQVAQDVAGARAVLPDYQPEMAPHRPEAYRDGDVWSWACKCGRRGTVPDVKRWDTKTEVAGPAVTAHDAKVAGGGL